ncbi:TetR/AcrR family transcriptional regulator [Maribacter sp. 2307ULW6-5]|uniref:TetR/AcrR family transcriptional regulator n=1 Tax=Maribacter sp. 2307ULW6-5 TaxID=3386275 RepID=UPI0039BD8A68
MPKNEVFNRDVVVQNAMNLFWQKGYGDTSMQDLVDVTGLGRSSIYNSFGSKMELYRIALDRYNAQSGQHFEKAMQSGKDPLDIIRTFFQLNLNEAMADQQKRGCMIVNCKTEMAQKDGHLMNWLLKNQEQTIAVFENLIEEAQKEGYANTNQSPTAYAHYLYNSLQGLRVSAITVSQRGILQDIVDNTFKLLQ